MEKEGETCAEGERKHLVIPLLSILLLCLPSGIKIWSICGFLLNVLNLVVFRLRFKEQAVKISECHFTGTVLSILVDLALGEKIVRNKEITIIILNLFMFNYML